MNVRTAAVMALAVAFLAGCSDPEPTPVPTSTAIATTASPTTASSPSPTPPTPEEEATAAAEEVVRDYFETVPRCLADPLNTEPSCFEDVAVGSELNDSRNSLIAGASGRTGSATAAARGPAGP